MSVDEATAQSQACPIVQVIDRVAGKWSVAILAATLSEPVRYTELEQAMPGISRRMLTLTLRNLERDGLLTRTVYPTIPPRVEYLATDSARELFTHLDGLTDWARRHQPDIIQAVEEFTASQQ
ncbi:HxlR family transcriptional regulator [Stackebrandtia endophytica]|uniref:HxlR family transcriptional regulator n=1 Tax=Stackebrandtia endophytica TaxID=1496996 RepID=A0A543B3I7_9ACTN|nr:helix-turn-helix domain-containing protein [Stackebrandtia endophytica]TQL79398.1 HxlR family transcriptional regulator [Stackebrandtia endophytica]